jgi:chemotaxis methyl-accepting protein methylase
MEDAEVDAADADRFVRALRTDPDTSRLVQAAADAITNRETWFFRDHSQLEQVVASAGRTAVRRGDQRLRALCAGCASGEEPLSLAMLALDAPHLFWGSAVDVTGFDLSPYAVERARNGIFRVQWETRFFRTDGERMLSRSWLSGRLRFEVHNLLGDPRRFAEGAYDVVLCRNVLIYFDEPAATTALQALASWVRPGGMLVLGTAEAGLVRDERLIATELPGAFTRQGDR